MKKLLGIILTFVSTLGMADQFSLRPFPTNPAVTQEARQLAYSAQDFAHYVQPYPNGPLVARDARQLAGEAGRIAQLAESGASALVLRDQFQRFVVPEHREFVRSYQQYFGTGPQTVLAGRFRQVNQNFQELKRLVVGQVVPPVPPPLPPFDPCYGLSRQVNIQCCINGTNTCSTHWLRVWQENGSCLSSASLYNPQVIPAAPAQNVQFTAVNPAFGSNNITVTLAGPAHATIQFYNYAGKFWGTCQY